MALWSPTVSGGFVLDRAARRRHSSMLDVSVEALAGSHPGGGVCSGRHYRELWRWRWLFRLLQQQRDIHRRPLSHRESFAGIRTGSDHIDRRTVFVFAIQRSKDVNCQR